MDEKSEQQIGDTKCHRLCQKSKFWLAFSGILVTLAVTALAATWIVMPPASKASNEIMFIIVKINIHISLWSHYLDIYHMKHILSQQKIPKESLLSREVRLQFPTVGRTM